MYQNMQDMEKTQEGMKSMKLEALEAQMNSPEFLDRKLTVAVSVGNVEEIKQLVSKGANIKNTQLLGGRVIF